MIRYVKMPQYPNPLCDENHNSIAFHKVHEAIAATIIRVTKDASETNLADFLTKPLTGKKHTQVMFQLPVLEKDEFKCFTYQLEGMCC